MFLKTSRLGENENPPPWFSTRGRRRGVTSSESRWSGFMSIDRCRSPGTEEHRFHTSSEHQTVYLSNKCTTKDFLRDFRHGYTVHGCGPKHWLIGVFIDTQTFSVPTNSHKTLIYGWMNCRTRSGHIGPTVWVSRMVHSRCWVITLESKHNRSKVL